MATQMMELVVLLVAPVPVGHRVEVCFLRRQVPGMVRDRVLEDDHQPVITDLDSGVVYGSELAWGDNTTRRQGAPLPLKVGPLADSDVKRRLVGRVRACRVVTVRGAGEVDVQTLLQVEVEG